LKLKFIILDLSVKMNSGTYVFEITTPKDLMLLSQVVPQKAKLTITCTNCGVTSTPEWRSGPLGKRTLCNACGLRYSKSKKSPQLYKMQIEYLLN